MEKIFTRDKVIQFVSNNANLKKDETTFFDVELSKIETILSKIESSPNKEFKFVSKNPKKQYEKFFNHFRLIEAAGGVVLNDNKEVLFIFRKGRWDLPKGKIDAGETRKDAAIREVMEETGLKNISIGEKISSTLHLYQIEDEWVIKKSYWYWMKSNDRELIPQAEEEITEAKWIPFSQLEEMQKLVYFSLSGLVGKINDCLLQGVRSTD